MQATPATVLPPQKAADPLNWAAGNASGSVDIGLRFWRLARDLIAKRAIEKFVKKSSAKRPIDARFNYLPCCTAYQLLQEQYDRADRQLDRQNIDLKFATRARSAELTQLRTEVSHLRSQLSEQNQDGTSQSQQMQLEREAARCKAQVRILRRQLLDQRAKIDAARQAMCQAQREAAERKMSLVLHLDGYDKNLALIHSEFEQGAAAPGAASDSRESDAQLQNAATELPKLQADIRAASCESLEADSQLRAMRVAHQQALQLMQEELQSIYAEAEDEPTTFSDDDRILLAQCNALRSASSRLMHFSGEVPLQPLPAGATQDLAGHINWFDELAAALTRLKHRTTALNT